MPAASEIGLASDAPGEPPNSAVSFLLLQSDTATFAASDPVYSSTAPTPNTTTDNSDTQHCSKHDFNHLSAPIGEGIADIQVVTRYTLLIHLRPVPFPVLNSFTLSRKLLKAVTSPRPTTAGILSQIETQLPRYRCLNLTFHTLPRGWNL